MSALMAIGIDYFVVNVAQQLPDPYPPSFCDTVHCIEKCLFQSAIFELQTPFLTISSDSGKPLIEFEPFNSN